jgi:hypothetical protein
MLDLIGHWLHLVAGVLLVGNALFWVVMTTGAARSSSRSEDAARLLGQINSGRWPHVIVPRSLRLPFPALAWIFLVVLGLSGVFLLQDRETPATVSSEAVLQGRFGELLRVKLGLLGVLLLGQVQLTVEPRRWLAFVNGALALAIVGVSVLLER